MNTRRWMLGLVVSLFCSGQVACADDPNSDGSASDSGADTDIDIDTDADSDDDWSECCLECSLGDVVPSESEGTPANMEAICAASGNPIVSTQSAAVQLTALYEPLNAATGFVQIPEELMDGVVGLPDIDFWRASTSVSADWNEFEVTDVEAVDGGFSFQVVWPEIPTNEEYWNECYYFNTFEIFLESRVLFSLICDSADGGEGEVVMVQAVTKLEWCYLIDGDSPDWYSSGAMCPAYCGHYWSDGGCY